MSKRIRTTRQARKVRAIIVEHVALRNRLQAEWDRSLDDRIPLAQMTDSRDQAQAWLEIVPARAEQKLIAIRVLHAKEQFGDCVEDGEPFPCKTVRILDWEAPEQPAKPLAAQLAPPTRTSATEAQREDRG